MPFRRMSRRRDNQMAQVTLAEDRELVQALARSGWFTKRAIDGIGQQKL